ncbi:MAG: nickel pincer cofactor biosynthesis protein LarC [Deltaproteobacteria bacterium]|nr:nickel pincer cofactor biosynthesis protein LarC [Deltaproteobacteria bacterium]
MSRRSSTGSRASSPGARLLHLDLFSGIAGNMFLGALLDLGLSRKVLEADLAGLGVEFTLRVRKVTLGGLAARHVRVGAPRSATSGKRRRSPRGRRYREIVALLRKARLEAAVRERALAIFEALGRAEARVHGIALERVHFHEVGALDAIVDVTAAAVGLERLGIERVTASPVALGEGTVETQHGLLPLPAPATLELLRGIPTLPAHVRWETVTPTGAAILRTLAEAYGPLPAMTIEAVGHGAGEDRPGPLPNVLRAVLGRDAAARADRVVLLETNLDDFVPEHFDYLMERLFAAGALDVSLQHLQMKKNRPGYLVRVLARPAERLVLAGILFAESTAIGVRVTESDRIVLDREERRVQTPFGRIRVKRVWDLEGRLLVSAEYDDCKRAAGKAGAPLREVVRAAEEAGRALG